MKKESVHCRGYTRVDTPTEIMRTTHGYVLRHTKTFKKHMLCMVVFLIYTYFECVASVSLMKDCLRAENSHQRVCSLGNGVETIHTIYFPPSHHSSQHPAHIILSSAPKCLQTVMFRSSIASQAAF